MLCSRFKQASTETKGNLTMFRDKSILKVSVKKSLESMYKDFDAVALGSSSFYFYTKKLNLPIIVTLKEEFFEVSVNEFSFHSHLSQNTSYCSLELRNLGYSDKNLNLFKVIVETLDKSDLSSIPENEVKHFVYKTLEEADLKGFRLSYDCTYRITLALDYTIDVSHENVSVLKDLLSLIKGLRYYKFTGAHDVQR